MRLIAVGELLADVVASGSGHDASIGVRPGGSAFNVAATASALGAEATVVGAVGDDPPGRMIVAELERLGIRVEVRVLPGRTGTFLVADGEIRVERGVSRTVQIPEALEADVVLVSGHLEAETIATAFARARAPWVGLDSARLRELPPGGNALIANDEAARRLTGKGPHETARELGARYRLVCVTRGPAGAVAVLDGRVETISVEPLEGDATGAGDAFAAALLVEVARGGSLAEALAAGAQWGARAVTRS